MSKIKQAPAGWETGLPDRSETGQYKINGQKTSYFWDGKKFHKLTKDLFGEYNWLEELTTQPTVKYHQLIKLRNVISNER